MITLADLPRIFEKAGYERDGLAKIGAILPQGRAVDPALVEETTRELTPANICARLFYMARSVTREHAELALTAPMCELLLAEGLLTVRDGLVSAPYAIVMIGSFVMLRDFEGWATGKNISADYVLGVGLATLMLSDFTVRRRAERALDIGTGQGFQAVVAAQHAASVVATDINPRALTLAAVAKRINDLDNIEFREGSFFEPVSQEKGSFDLIVSNPPFVIAPPHDIVAIGGRWSGDSFVEELLKGIPEYLADDGFGCVLCNWHHPTEQDWTTRIGSWFEGRGVDTWVIRVKVDSARKYATSWLREAASSGGESAMADAMRELDRWLEYYKSINLGAVSLGAVIMHKRKPGTVPNWTRFDATNVDQCNGSISDQAQRIFAAETLIRGMRSHDEVFALKLGLADECQLTQQKKVIRGKWQVTQSLLRQSAGLECATALDPLPLEVLSKLEIDRPCGEIIGAMASAMGADPAIARRETAPFLVQMLRQGHVVFRH